MTPPKTNQPLTIEQEKRQVWHNAAYAGIQAELYEDLDNIDIITEEKLNQEPLRLDVLVIKKKPGVTLKKNFARMFKGHNIIEYKSPDDSLTIEAYLKAIGYTCLYQALRKEVRHEDITLTLMCTKHPRDLMKFLNNSGHHKVSEDYPGIYKIEGENFPVQILESKKLSKSDNLWLRNLRKDSEAEELQDLVALSGKISDKVRLENYWNTIVSANKDFERSVVNMTYAEIDAKLERLFGMKTRMAESKAEGKAEGKTEGKVEGVNLMLKLIMQGLSPDEAAQRIRESANEPVTVV